MTISAGIRRSIEDSYSAGEDLSDLSVTTDDALARRVKAARRVKIAIAVGACIGSAIGIAAALYVMNRSV